MVTRVTTFDSIDPKKRVPVQSGLGLSLKKVEDMNPKYLYVDTVDARSQVIIQSDGMRKKDSSDDQSEITAYAV